MLFSGILSISANSCSQVIRWAYQHYILAAEVKNSAKGTLFSFSTIAVFLHDVMESANNVL